MDDGFVLHVERELADQLCVDLGQPGERCLGGLRAVVVGQVDHQQGGIGRADDVGHPGLQELRRDRRQVHELNLHILPGHHPRLRSPGGERIRRDLGPGVGQGGEQGALARVGGADAGRSAPLLRGIPCG